MKDVGNKDVMAKNLQYYMAKSGIKASDLSKAISVPYTTVRSWIRAENYPRIDKIDDMADYFGILKSDLIEDKSDNQFVSPEIDEKNRKLAKIHHAMIQDPALMLMVEKLAGMNEDERASIQQILDLINKNK